MTATRLESRAIVRLAAEDENEDVRAFLQGLVTNDVSGDLRAIDVPLGGYAYTLCQVPVVYQGCKSDSITVHFSNGGERTFDGLSMDAATSRKLFSRDGEIREIRCRFQKLSHNDE